MSCVSFSLMRSCGMRLLFCFPTKREFDISYPVLLCLLYLDTFHLLEFYKLINWTKGLTVNGVLKEQNAAIFE